MLRKILSRGSKADHIILIFNDVIHKFCQLQGLCNFDKRKAYTEMKL